MTGDRLTPSALDQPAARSCDGGQPRFGPLGQLMLARLREFYREPEAVFWVYGFPLLMVVALGIAFRNQPIERLVVDVEQGPQARQVAEALGSREGFEVAIHTPADCRRRLRTGQAGLYVVVHESQEARYDYYFDPQRPESLLARNAVDDALQRAAGRSDPAATKDHAFSEPGGRYVDWLVPGLLGMSLMGGGLWGVGFVIVDMRIRKLLKRFLATPMKKTHFMAGIMLSRLVFMVPEVFLLLLFARLAFSVRNHGSLAAVTVLILLGAFTFSGLGLLVASRARTIEAVSGLMNLVMLPMWMLSGIFFSASRFPEAVQPVIRALPLTLLIDALRAVMLEGAPLASEWIRLAGLAAWGVISFALALKWFRWIV
ncbi:MAG: ABC transporter permease [Pirellulales bacterium]